MKPNTNPKQNELCSAIILAAGSSQRMGEDKITISLFNIPVIIRTLKVFDSSDYISEHVVVCSKENIEKIRSLIVAADIKKPVTIIEGGNERAVSSYLGVRASSIKSDLVAIHDAARPLVSAEIVKSTVSAAIKHGAAAPALKIYDTARLIDESGTVQSIKRDAIRLYQTPQVFSRRLYLENYEKSKSFLTEITDDCELFYRNMTPVFLTEGSFENIKLTSPADILLAELIIKRGNIKCE